MGRKIYGHTLEDDSKTKDVNVTEFDNGVGSVNITVDYPTMSIWNGDEVVVGGFNESIGTDWEDLSNIDADNTYLTCTSVTTVSVSSSSVADSHDEYGAATSGGARVVRLHYLNADWDATTADAYMSGVSSVEIATDVLRVNKLEVVKVGVSGSSAGNIVAASGTTVYLKIDECCNESYGGYYYVPDGKNLIITDAFCYPLLGNAFSLEFVYKVEEPKVVGATTNYIENYKWAGSYKSGSSMNMAPNMNLPLLVNGRCRIRVRAKSSEAIGSAIGYFKGYLVDEKA